MARILQVCNTDFYLERFLKPLVIELKKRGHEVECICTGTGYSSDFSAHQIPVHQLRFPSRSSPIQFLACTLEMRRLLKSRPYDCVNSHNRNSSIVARLASWLAKVPSRVYTAHGMYFHDGQNRLAFLATELIEAFLAKFTTFTLSQSDEDTRRMIQRGWIAKDRILTIGNGINTEKFSSKTARRSVEGPFRIVALGRLVAGKGYEDLIRAFHLFRAEVPNSELLIIGGNIAADFDPAASRIQGLAKELGVFDAMRVTGIVNNVEEYLATGDLFVHPSYREGMPRALLEAMCMGLPVIATSIRGAREIIREGENGFLFAPHDWKELAGLLLRVQKMAPADRRAVGEKARETALRQFDEKAYVARQADALESLLRGAPAR
ncbi:MAG: glycosyltransferase family 4 protein [Bdellovibrionota bacterium]